MNSWLQQHNPSVDSIEYCFGFKVIGLSIGYLDGYLSRSFFSENTTTLNDLANYEGGSIGFDFKLNRNHALGIDEFIKCPFRKTYTSKSIGYDGLVTKFNLLDDRSERIFSNLERNINSIMKMDYYKCQSPEEIKSFLDNVPHKLKDRIGYEFVNLLRDNFVNINRN